MNDFIKTINRTRQTPFSRWNKINRVERPFNDNQTIRRNGKEITLQEYINENNKDCTIYDVMKTYNGDLKLTQAKMNTLTHTVADELASIKDLRSAMEVMKKSEAAWRELPLEIRKDFGNDVNKFQTNGLKWAQDKIKAYEAEQKAKAEAAKAAENQMKGETNNG